MQTYITQVFKNASADNITYSLDSVIVILIASYVISIGLTLPKKSVIGTLLTSLLNKSFRTPTVEMQTLFGHTFNCNKS